MLQEIEPYGGISTLRKRPTISTSKKNDNTSFVTNINDDNNTNNDHIKYKDGKNRKSKNKKQKDSTTKPTTTTNNDYHGIQYPHNTELSIVLLPAISCSLFPSWYDNMHTIYITCYLLLLYTLDLMNIRDFSIVSLWVGILILGIITIIFKDYNYDVAETSTVWMILTFCYNYVFKNIIQLGLITCIGLWMTLQYEWIHLEVEGNINDNDIDDGTTGLGMEFYSIWIEGFLFYLSILCCSISECIIVLELIDKNSIMIPFMVLSIMAWNISWLSSLPSSIQKTKKALLVKHNILFTIILLCAPFIMQIIVSRHAESFINVMYDFMILTSITIMLVFIILPNYNILWWFPISSKGMVQKQDEDNLIRKFLILIHQKISNMIHTSNNIFFYIMLWSMPYIPIQERYIIKFYSTYFVSSLSHGSASSYFYTLFACSIAYIWHIIQLSSPSKSDALDISTTHKQKILWKKNILVIIISCILFALTASLLFNLSTIHLLFIILSNIGIGVMIYYHENKFKKWNTNTNILSFDTTAKSKKTNSILLEIISSTLSIIHLYCNTIQKHYNQHNDYHTINLLLLSLSYHYYTKNNKMSWLNFQLFTITISSLLSYYTTNTKNEHIYKEEVYISFLFYLLILSPYCYQPSKSSSLRLGFLYAYCYLIVPMLLLLFIDIILHPLIFSIPSNYINQIHHSTTPSTTLSNLFYYILQSIVSFLLSFGTIPKLIFKITHSNYALSKQSFWKFCNAIIQSIDLFLLLWGFITTSMYHYYYTNSTPNNEASSINSKIFYNEKKTLLQKISILSFVLGIFLTFFHFFLQNNTASSLSNDLQLKKKWMEYPMLFLLLLIILISKCNNILHNTKNIFYFKDNKKPMLILVLLSLSLSFCISFLLLQYLQQYQDQQDQLLFIPLVISTFCIHFFGIVTCILGYYSYNVTILDGMNIIKRLSLFILGIIPFLVGMNWIFFEYYTKQQDDNSSITLFFHSTLKIRHHQQHLYYHNTHHGTNYEVNAYTCGWFTILFGIISIYFFLFGCIMNYTTYGSTASKAATTSPMMKRRKKYGNVSILLSWIGSIIIFLGEVGLIGTHSILYSSNDNTKQRGMRLNIFDWVWNTFSPCVIGTVIVSMVMFALDLSCYHSTSYYQTKKKAMSKPSFTFKKKQDEKNEQPSSLYIVIKIITYPITKIVNVFDKIRYNIQQIHINTSTSLYNRFIPYMTSIIMVYFTICLYVIFIRGYNHNFEKDGNIITYNDIVTFMQHHQQYSYDDDDEEDKATTAILQHYLQLHPPSDNPNLIRLAKLAASGFWTTTINNTTSSYYGPILHIIGLLCILPNLYLLFSYYWKSSSSASTSFTAIRKIALLLPLNLFPLFICIGIPALKALSAVCILCSTYQYFDMKYMFWKNKMKI